MVLTIALVVLVIFLLQIIDRLRHSQVEGIALFMQAAQDIMRGPVSAEPSIRSRCILRNLRATIIPSVTIPGKKLLGITT